MFKGQLIRMCPPADGGLQMDMSYQLKSGIYHPFSFWDIKTSGKLLMCELVWSMFLANIQHIDSRQQHKQIVFSQKCRDAVSRTSTRMEHFSLNISQAVHFWSFLLQFPQK